MPALTSPPDPSGDRGGPPAPAPGRWRGELALRFAARADATYLAARRHLGPLQVQRAFHPEGPGVCHVYLLHPPGGLVAGDDLEIGVQVGPAAHALVTTPASTKVYRSDGVRVARQVQRLEVGPGARLEWLPQDTIVFDGAQAELATRVDLAADAHFLGWEILALGRPASGETFRRGRCRQRLELWREGRPLVVERTRFDGDAEVAAAGWGLGGATALATLLASPAPEGDLDQLRAVLQGDGDGDGGDDGDHSLPAEGSSRTSPRASASLIDGALVCRVFGQGAAAVRARCERVWRLLRPALFGRPACSPRIWST